MRIYEQYEDSSGVITFLFKEEIITGEKLKRLEIDISQINQMYPIYDRFMPLSNKYDKLQEWEQGKNDTANQINEIVAGFISTSVSFVEQWSSFLKNEYPNLAPFYNEEQKLMYENTFAYRLIYNLRNMAIHTHHSPFNTISRSIVKKALIKLEKSYFLTVHKHMQPSFKKELEKTNQDSFNLVEIIQQCFSALSALHEKISSKIMEDLSQGDLIGSAYRILKFYKEHQAHNGVLGLTNDEINLEEFLKEDFKQKFKFKEVPYNLAHFCAQSVAIKQTNVGMINKSLAEQFSTEYNGVIYKGANCIEYEHVKWIKVCEPIFKIGNETYIYNVLYMIEGLLPEDYEQKGDVYFIEKRKEVSLLLESNFKNEISMEIANSSEIVLIYIFDEEALQQEILYSGPIEELKKKHLGNDWNGFGLGDRFKVDDKEVRVFKHVHSISINKERYFIGPANLNVNKINYENLSRYLSSTLIKNT